ncbi:MAG: DUF1127 domain-containing protein, partial [Pseudomonadota bacterium]
MDYAYPYTSGFGEWAYPGAIESSGPSVFARLRERFEKRRIFRETVKQLQELDDHQLSDIGVSRYDIPRVAEDAARA